MRGCHKQLEVPHFHIPRIKHFHFSVSPQKPQSSNFVNFQTVWLPPPLSHVSLITLLTFHIPWAVKLSRIHFFLLPWIWEQRHDLTCSQMAADSRVIPSTKRKHIQPSVNSQVCGGSPVLVCFIFPYVFYQFPSLLLSFIIVFYSPASCSFRLRLFNPNSLFYLSSMLLPSTLLLHAADTFSTSFLLLVLFFLAKSWPITYCLFLAGMAIRIQHFLKYSRRNIGNWLTWGRQ